MAPKRKATSISSNANTTSFAPRKIRVQRKKDSRTKEQQDVEKRQTWFNKYADSDNPDTIGPDGCQQFFSDLGVSLESIVPFIIGWKMNSTQMGYITRADWTQTLVSQNVSDEEGLKHVLSEWERTTTQNPDIFKQLYLFTFNYVKSSTQKSMDVETAVALWHVMLETQYPIITSFIKFIEEVKPVKVINKDQWSSLLDFCKAVPENLQDYDTTSSWPVLFDDYVEWRQQALN